MYFFTTNLYLFCDILETSLKVISHFVIYTYCTPEFKLQIALMFVFTINKE